MKRISIFKISVTFVLLFIAVLLESHHAFAAEVPITVKNGDAIEVPVHVQDTGKITLDSSSLLEGQTINRVSFQEQQENLYNEYNPNPYGTLYQPYSNTGSSDDATVITYTSDEGSFNVISKGTQTLYVYGYDINESIIFSASVKFISTIDMTNVELGLTEGTMYHIPSYISEKGKSYYYAGNAQIQIPITNIDTGLLNEETEVGIVSSDNKLKFEGRIQDGKLFLYEESTKEGVSSLTITIEGKVFLFNITVTRVTINKNSLLIGKRKKAKLQVTGYSGNIVWSSTKNDIVRVSSNGTVKGLKAGNCVVRAKLESGQYLGCAVSVVHPKLVKVCSQAEYIGRHWKYDQSKRQKSGYYDCSALVWKAYKKGAGMTFGSGSYPGTSDTEAAWCRDHKRMVKGGYKYKNINKMKINPGDIIFKSPDMKHKYVGTVHVEMFTGYTCNSVDLDGNVNVSCRFGARGEGSYYEYSFEQKSLWARPMKY